MTTEQKLVEDIKAEIRKLPAEQELEVLKLADVFRKAVVSTGVCGAMALALVGAEISAEE